MIKKSSIMATEYISSGFSINHSYLYTPKYFSSCNVEKTKSMRFRNMKKNGKAVYKKDYWR